MRGLFSMLIVILLAVAFMPAVSMSDQASMEPAVTLLDYDIQAADVLAPAEANQECQGEISKTVSVTVNPIGADGLEVSAVALGYKPVAAGQYKSDFESFAQKNALISASQNRSNVMTEEYRHQPNLTATFKNQHSTHCARLSTSSVLNGRPQVS